MLAILDLGRYPKQDLLGGWCCGLYLEMVLGKTLHWDCFLGGLFAIVSASVGDGFQDIASGVRVLGWSAHCDSEIR